MSTTQKTLIGVLLLMAVVMLVSIFIGTVQTVQGAAPSGLPATIATSTSYKITGQLAKTIVGTSSCSSRIITVASSTGGAKLTFTDKAGAVPSDMIGHFQAGSTTAAYDSGIYGCDAVKIYLYNTGSVYVDETN